MDLNQIIANVTITKAMSVSEGSLPSGYSAIIQAGIIYDGVKLSTAMDWATANRLIPLARILRDKCTVEFLNELHRTGLRIHANDCGKPILSRSDRIAEFTKRGFSQEMAAFAVDNPAEFASTVAGLKPPKPTK
jgi:hypothetical protein